MSPEGETEFFQQFHKLLLLLLLRLHKHSATLHFGARVDVIADFVMLTVDVAAFSMFAVAVVAAAVVGGGGDCVAVSQREREARIV